MSPGPPDGTAIERGVMDELGSPAGRRQITRMGHGVGLAWFAMHYLRLATPACHRRWYEAFDEALRLLFLAPRSHGKSISAGRVLVGHRIVTDRDVRVLVVGKTKDAARKTARLVRRDLEKNPRIRSDWTGPGRGGPFNDPGQPWTDSFFYVRRSREARDPTVEAVGLGGAITGGRFDLVVMDDPIDDASCLTAQQRRKIVQWFYGTILELLDTGGRIVVIGTRKHADDLYNTLEQDPTFRVVRDQAIVEWPDMARVVWDEQIDSRTGRLELRGVTVPPGRGKVLWPEKWSLEALLIKQRSMGSVLFSRENQNEVIDDGSSPFRIGWMNAAKDPTRGFLASGMVPRVDADGVHHGEVEDAPDVEMVEHPRCAGLIIWQCWDLSLVDDEEKAQVSDADWTVGQTWGLDWTTRTRYLLRMVRRRGLTQGEMMLLIRTEAALFPQRLAVVVETNAFGKLYQMGLKRTTDLPVRGHFTDKRKHSLFEGVPAMSVLYEHGKVVLPYGAPAQLGAGEVDPRADVDVFVAEHHGLGREAHDDTVMCGWVGDVWVRKWEVAEERRRGTV